MGAACRALSRDKDDAACAEVRVALFLDSVRTHAFRKYFAEPVPSKQLAGYEHVVARPMDLGTIEKRLKSGAYAGSTGAARAVSDIRAVACLCFVQRAAVADLPSWNYLGWHLVFLS